MLKNTYKAESRRARIWARIVPASQAVLKPAKAITRHIGTAY